jgi:ketosteroid isomerase-like protein
MKKILTCLALFIASISIAQNSDVLAIEQILAKQEKAWNDGDIPTFMIGYWENDSLVFVGKSGLAYGYAKNLANYKKNYPDTTYMGKLHFDIINLKPLGKAHYFVIGKWHLKRTIGDVGGYFTLLFKKTKNGWKIIADHTD